MYAVTYRIDIESVVTETFSEQSLAKTRYDELVAHHADYSVWLVQILERFNSLQDPDGV